MSGLMISQNEVIIISRYCSEEVRRQYWHEWEPEAPLRVGGMIKAWMRALEASYSGEPLTPDLIREWGISIEPFKNQNGFRQVPIHVGWQEKLNWALVPRAIEQLCENIEDVPALDAYRQFEEIHPFRDGNGRTGKIILNWINGSLLNPIFPPDDFWGDEIVNP